MTATERRQFKVDQHATVHMIYSQAGSIEKALLENVMNAIDAGASQVNVTVTEAGYEVSDDGRGFRTMSEIEDYFERFAFNHDGDALQSERTYGRFGIGRAQQWKYARCTYRSRTFQMDMDLRERQLRYLLTENLDDHPGTRVTGTWYEPLTYAALTKTQEELARFLRYSPVPVLLGGKLVSVQPEQERWTFITEQARVRLKRSPLMTIYNMGMYVTDLAADLAGGQGVLVSRVALPLNMARNEVESTDPTWQAIVQANRQETQARLRRSSTLTRADQAVLSAMIRSGEPLDDAAVKQMLSARLIQDVTGRMHTLRGFLEEISLRPAMPRVANEPTTMQYLHEQRLAFVIDQSALWNFRVDTAAMLVDIVHGFLSRHDPKDIPPRADLLSVEHYREIDPDLKPRMTPVPDEDLSPKEALYLALLRGPLATYMQHMRVQAGRSDVQTFEVNVAEQILTIETRQISQVGTPAEASRLLYDALIATYRALREPDQDEAITESTEDDVATTLTQDFPHVTFYLDFITALGREALERNVKLGRLFVEAIDLASTVRAAFPPSHLN